jgi:hypothetical protein
MPTVYTEVEVDVELDDFDDDDLIEEVERRNLGVNTDMYGRELVERIYQLRRNGQDYQVELDQLIYNVTGKFV